MIQLSDDSAIRKRLDAETQIKHLLHTDIETSDATSLIWMISQNLGVSVLPENAAMIPTNGSVCFLPIEGFEKTRKLYLISNKKRTVSPAAGAFMDVIRTVAQGHSKSAIDN